MNEKPEVSSNRYDEPFKQLNTYNNNTGNKKQDS